MEEAWIERAKVTCYEIATNFREMSGLAPWIAVAAETMVGALEGGNKAIFCGNGGSAADCQHLAAELLDKHLVDRKSLAAISLASDPATITSICGSAGFDEIYARQLRGVGRQGDVLVVLSTSGTSANIVNAARAARDMGIKIVALTGADGGELAGYADTAIKVPATRPDRVQELHKATGHMICDIVEEMMQG